MTEEIKLGIRRNDDESWLDAAKRAAEPYGLESVVKEYYEMYIEKGYSEADAALHACSEWDVVDLL